MIDRPCICESPDSVHDTGYVKVDAGIQGLRLEDSRTEICQIPDNDAFLWQIESHKRVLSNLYYQVVRVHCKIELGFEISRLRRPITCLQHDLDTLVFGASF